MEERDYQENWLDEALQSYPLADLPPGFVQRVMARVAAQPRTAVPRFRLQFLDVAVALAWSSLFVLVLVGIFSYTGQIQVEWLPVRTLTAWLAGVPTAVSLWLGLGVIIIAEITLGLLVCTQLWQDRPYLVNG